jgi:hypothetical protein
MLRLLWVLSVRIRYFLRRYMPTNILLDLIRTRRGLKWGIPAMLLAAPYLLAASVCTNIIGGEWSHRLAQPPRAAVHMERDEVPHHGTGQLRPPDPRPHPGGHRTPPQHAAAADVRGNWHCVRRVSRSPACWGLGGGGALVA